MDLNRKMYLYRGSDDARVSREFRMVDNLDLNPVEELPQGVEEHHVEEVGAAERMLKGGLRTPSSEERVKIGHLGGRVSEHRLIRREEPAEHERDYQKS